MEEFDYLNSNVSVPFNESMADRSREAFSREVKDKARLMYNLRFGKKEAVERILGNIAWEFDDTWTTRLPEGYEDVESIVDAVYGKMAGKKD